MKKHPLPDIGTRFSKLVTIAPPFKINERWRVACRCECGTERAYEISNLRSGNTTSCGCYRKEFAKNAHTKHGDHARNSTARLYRIWCNIISRCENPNTRSYKDYGGIGVTICDQWRHDYASFRDWATLNGYQDDLLIDRIDNSQGYFPENCRWIDRIGQNRNRRNSVFVEAFGVSKLLAEWVDDTRCSVSHHTLYARIFQYKWEPERAIVTPYS